MEQLHPALPLSAAALSLVPVALQCRACLYLKQRTSVLPQGSRADQSNGARSRWSWSWLLPVMAVLDALGWLICAIRLLWSGGDRQESAALALFGAGWAITGLNLLLRPPASASLSLFSFQLYHVALALISACLPLFNLRSTPPTTFSPPFVIAHGTILLASLGLVTSLPLSPRVGEYVEEAGNLTSEDQSPSPEDEGTVRLRDWLALSWIKPLLDCAAKGPIRYADVWRLPRSLRSGEVRRRSEKRGGERLLDRLFNNNRKHLVGCLLLGVASSALAYANPLFLRLILLRFASDAPNARAQAYFFAALTLLAQLVRATVDMQQAWFERQVIVKVRTAIMGEVYVKGLTRMDASGSVPKKGSKRGKGGEKGGPASLGRIISMMNTDANKIANLLPTLISLASAPFELVIAITLLYRLLGWPALAGMAVLGLSIPLNQLLVRRRMKLHPHVLGSRDHRMETLNEFIHAIRFVKYSASEEQWLARVDVARAEELKWLFRTRANYMLMHCLWFVVPDVILVVAFGCLTKVVGQRLDVSTAFAALGLFVLVRAPLAQLPTSLSMITQTWITLQRLETFFAEPDVSPRVSSLQPSYSSHNSSAISSPVSIREGTFRYRPTPPAQTGASETTPLLSKTNAPTLGAFSLGSISIDFPIGKLTLVTGPTGSGKSSLLLALLGEMYQESGSVALPKGSLETDFAAETGLYKGVAYASQLPWLQHASIKDNILFGSPMEEERYASVIEACALQADLAMFDAGDETEVGEKGISLSGGQKARVALARAVYSRARTVLLDDPLSAVDSHTAKHLFRKCLKGPLLEDRTTILVTHHVSLCLTGADYLVHLHSGKVVAQSFVADLAPTEVAQELQEEVEAPSSAHVDSRGNEEKSRQGGKLVLEEKRETGRIKTKVYALYLKAAGYETWAVLVLLVFVGRFSRVLDRVWFKIWAESYSQPSPPFPSANDHLDFYLVGYAAIAVASVAVTLLSILTGFRGSLKASRTLFRATTRRLANAPFRYFDTTPTGRLLNRFGADFQTVDAAVTDQIRVAVTYLATALISVGVVTLISPAFLLAAILLSCLYTRLSLSYVKTSRDLRRLESNARSPIFSHFGEILGANGIVTVRAFGAERRLLAGLSRSVDQFLSVNYAGALINRWLIWRFDVLGGLAIAVTTALALLGRASPGLAALAITSAQAFVVKLYDLCRIISSLEVDLNSVERVSELLEIDQEPPSTIEGKRPPAHWPSRTGGIVLENLVISYAPELAPVIKGVSVEFGAGQKIGLVGRTGSGKSTLALSLLRFTDPLSGRILLDGIDITTIGTFDLRSRLTYIAQESALFSGTVRYNVDPFNEHSDEACTRALARVHLIEQADSSGRLGVNLDSPVAPGGHNFSAGQRQLLAMARALLQESNVIIMDEATSGVDVETDAKIQGTIRAAFSHCLVLTIAHRLSSVVDYDKVLVLDQGRLLEFGAPTDLLQRPEGAFRALCEQAADWTELRARVGL